jgi:hypothetical protein
MKQYKVITYKKLYPYGRPSQMKTPCDICSKIVEHGKMFAVIDTDDFTQIDKGWVCSKRCINMYILSKI